MPAQTSAGYFVFNSSERNRMSGELNRHLCRLQELNLSIRHALESAELIVPQLNSQVESLFAIGALPPRMLLGHVVHETPYPAGGPIDSNLLIVAALGVGHGGFGVVSFDSEGYLAYLNDPQPLNGVVILNFMPFMVLTPAVRGLILPHVEPLLKRALACLRKI